MRGGAIDKILNFIANSNLATTYTTDDGWTVKKYANGEAECWTSTGSISIPSTAFIAWGGMYIVDAADGFQGIDYPSGLFIEPPREWADPHFGDSTASVALWPGANNTSEHSYGYCYVRGTKSNSSVSIDIYAKGRWKE